MKRMMVKPISGKFNYICSPEWIYELIDDPRVKAYMDIEQTTGKLWSTGEPFDLFELNFIPTLLDEFAYPDTEFPGVYETADGKETMRYYATPDKGATIYYLDITETEGKSTADEVTYLADGTAIENKVTWKKPSQLSSITKVKKATRKFNEKTGLIEYTAITEENAPEGANEMDWIELPVVRGILFGDEAMVKLNVEGVSDAPKMIVKPLGSSGVADPLDQRQSVGFRVDGFGLAIKRPEAVCITYGLCRNAALAALAYSTADVLHGEYTLMHNEASSANVNYIDESKNVQVMNVDGVNGTRVFVEYDPTISYSEGTMVSHTVGTGKNKKVHYYVFLEGFKETEGKEFTKLVESDGTVSATGKGIIVKVNPNIVK
jgi:hypothetical protein